MTAEIRTTGLNICLFQAAVQDRLNEQEGVPSVFNPPPSRPLQVNTADHRVYSYIVSRPQPRVGLETGIYCFTIQKWHTRFFSTLAHTSPVSLGNSATYMLCVILRV